MSVGTFTNVVCENQIDRIINGDSVFFPSFFIAGTGCRLSLFLSSSFALTFMLLCYGNQTLMQTLGLAYYVFTKSSK